MYFFFFLEDISSVRATLIIRVEIKCMMMMMMSVLANWEMPLDKLTLLWEDNQFGRKDLFTFDRFTATELETGLSIVLASSDKW